MPKRRIATKPKPTVAFENQAAARLNIISKIELIVGALGARAQHVSRATPLPDDLATALQPRLPITVRQFNRWSVDDLPSDLHSKLSKFKRNANQTLHAQDLYESAALAVKAVVEFKKQTAEARPFDTLNGLRRRLSIANKLREIAEKEILALKATCRAREVEVSSLRKQLVELSIRVRSKS